MRLERQAAYVAVSAACFACQVPSPAVERGSQPPPVPVSAPLSSQSAEPPAAKAPAATSPTTPAPRTFAEDVQFLSQHGPIKLLESPAGGRVAVSGKYQARVMTSAVEASGPSLGFVNRSFIESGKTATPFDNYGGEDRFWLGPEGGQYGLYFPPGKPFEFGNWQTPHSFQEGEWKAKDAGSATSITFLKSLTLSNYSATELRLDVERKVSVLTSEQAKVSLGMDMPPGLQWVGFATDNTVTNKGTKAWTEDKGLPSIWILGMFNPAPGTLVVAPFHKDGLGEIVNDRYFGKVGPDRLQVNKEKGFVLFKCDGQFRSKIGLSATRAKSVIGSYSPQSKLLTIVRYTRPKEAKRYVNNLWEIQKQPYAGDVNNAYNDGPVEPGKPALGGFYELESSSPAAALAAGASLKHVHETFHFSGSREALDAISAKVLGVSLADVEKAGM